METSEIFRFLRRSSVMLLLVAALASCGEAPTRVTVEQLLANTEDYYDKSLVLEAFLRTGDVSTEEITISCKKGSIKVGSFSVPIKGNKKVLAGWMNSTIYGADPNNSSHTKTPYISGRQEAGGSCTESVNTSSIEELRGVQGGWHQVVGKLERDKSGKDVFKIDDVEELNK